MFLAFIADNKKGHIYIKICFNYERHSQLAKPAKGDASMFPIVCAALPGPLSL